MPRKQLTENKQIKEQILQCIKDGTNHHKDICQKLQKDARYINTVLDRLVSFGYLEDLADNYQLKNNIQWCKNCNLIPNYIHPKEWCE